MRKLWRVLLGVLRDLVSCSNQTYQVKLSTNWICSLCTLQNLQLPDLHNQQVRLKFGYMILVDPFNTRRSLKSTRQCHKQCPSTKLP